MTTKKKPLRNYQKPRTHQPLNCPEPGRTKQAFKDDCDINKIMGRYRKTGKVPQSMRPKRYGEQKIDGFTEMHNKIASVKTMFEELPPETKALFEDQNDFIEALSNPDREDELVEAGVAYLPEHLMAEEPTDEEEEPPETTTETPSPPPCRQRAKRGRSLTCREKQFNILVTNCTR